MKILFKMCSFLITLSLLSCGGGKPGSGVSSLTSNLSSPYKYYVYVANYGDNTISSFSMDKGTGVLTPIETTASEGNPISLAISPSGDRLYVAKGNSSSLQVFNINKTNGALTHFQSITTNNVTQSSVTISNDGRFVYVTSYSGLGNIYSVSSLTGNLSTYKNLDATAMKATIYPNNNLMLLTSSSGVTLWPIDQTSGDVLISGGAYTASTPLPNAVALSNGKMYVSYNYQGYGLINSYNINEVNKIGTPIQLGLASGNSIGGIAISNFGKVLIATEPNANKIRSFLINQSSGVLTEEDSKTTANYPQHIKIFPDGQYALIVNKVSKSISTFLINENSGSLKSIGEVSAGTDPQDIVIVKISE